MSGPSGADAGLAVALVILGVTRACGGSTDLRSVEPLDCAFPLDAREHEGLTVEVECSEFAADGRALRGPARLLFGLPLDLNIASALSLESLPSIGPGRAAAIVEARCVERFDSLDAIRRVRGIGARTIDGLRGWAIAEAKAICPATPKQRQLAPHRGRR
ncbi:MAG: helix-hairpin-helix domain-containing protein [Myxococcota bacterium]|nr:helix-hairpin-helix domain-containing protein [Myxococcota bacterium]